VSIAAGSYLSIPYDRIMLVSDYHRRTGGSMSHSGSQRILGAVAAACLALAGTRAVSTQSPAPPPTALVTGYESFTVGPVPPELGYDADFYKKYVDALGIPVISSAKVPDRALLMARDIVVYMLANRPDIRREMVARKFRVGIMAQTEMTTDIPEQRDRKKPTRDDARLTRSERENYDKPGGIGSQTDKEYWDRRARGLGGVYTTGAEENVLGYPGTRYYGEHILVHEWSHGIMSAIRTADPALYAAIQAAYKDAMAKGLYKGHYAETTANEYWAEGTQWWFWSNYEWTDANGTRLQTPDDLKAYDPKLFELLGQVYLGHHIPADIYHGKNIRPQRR
jgi:hypothetical protein